MFASVTFPMELFLYRGSERETLYEREYESQGIGGSDGTRTRGLLRDRQAF